MVVTQLPEPYIFPLAIVITYTSALSQPVNLKSVHTQCLGVVQKALPQLFCDIFRKCTWILKPSFFTDMTAYVWRMKIKLCLLHHLYSVTTLPSKTYIIDNTDATFLNV